VEEDDVEEDFAVVTVELVVAAAELKVVVAVAEPEVVVAAAVLIVVVVELEVSVEAELVWLVGEEMMPKLVVALHSARVRSSSQQPALVQ
jgi:hypothetical protein